MKRRKTKKGRFRRAKMRRRVLKVKRSARRFVRKAKPKIKKFVVQAKAKLKKINRRKVEAELRKAKSKLKIAKAKALEADRKVSAYAKNNPEKALAIAVAAGYVIGRAVGAIKRRK